jgi:hypothetical protein
VITLAGEQLVSRTLLIATGVVDRIPELAGIEDLYGRSVFHCPYGVALHEGRVARLEGDGGVLRRIVYHDAESLTGVSCSSRRDTISAPISRPASAASSATRAR